MQINKQQLEPDMEHQTSSKFKKEYIKAIYCHPAYLIYKQSTSCEMPDWMKHKLESRLLGEISTTSDMQMTLMVESKEELKSLLMKLKEESEKAGLKLSIQKTKIMAFSPITLWQIDGETVETVRDFFCGVPKLLQMVTAAMKLKDACCLEEKSMTNLDSIVKCRDIILPTKSI